MDETFGPLICETCGRTSKTLTVCSHCGAKINFVPASEAVFIPKGDPRQALDAVAEHVGSPFLEIVVNGADAAAAGLDSRDEIEEPLEEALAASELGAVTGGGGGSGVYIIDIEIAAAENFDKALEVIRRVLQDLKVPPSTRIKQHSPKKDAFPVYV